jgi:hypothetical protein
MVDRRYESRHVIVDSILSAISFSLIKNVTGSPKKSEALVFVS